MQNPEININRLTSYRGVKAKLALLTPSSLEFENLLKESEALWSELSPEERAIAHEEVKLNLNV